MIWVRLRDILLRIFGEWNIEITTIISQLSFVLFIILLFNSVFFRSLGFNFFFYHRMISRSSYFGFLRKHWMQLSGSKNSQRGLTTGSAQIWSPTWEAQTLSGRLNGWVTVWLDLWLNPSLPGYWRTLNRLAQYSPYDPSCNEVWLKVLGQKIWDNFFITWITT